MRVWSAFIFSVLIGAQIVTLEAIASVEPAGPQPSIRPLSLVRPPLEPVTAPVDVPPVPKSEQVEGLVLTPARFTPDDVHQAASTSRHPSTMSLIFRLEIGGVGYDPYATHSDSRCVGPGALCSFGLLGEFGRRGFTDPHSPYQVARYIDQVLDEGRACNWAYLC